RELANSRTPSSAATVTGVVCETSPFDGVLEFASSRLACGCEPTPTPAKGWWRNTRPATATRCVLPLVSDRADCPFTLAATRPPPTSAKQAVAIATTRRPRRSPAARVTATTTTNSARRPDCEYE